MQVIIDIDEEQYEFIENMTIDIVKNYHAFLHDMCERIAIGTPLDNLRSEIEDYITHSPYIKSFKNCCCLRDDVMRIIDKYKTGNEE